MLSIKLYVTERETGGKTEMGIAASGKITEGHYARVPGRLRPKYHGEEAGHVCPQQS